MAGAGFDADRALSDTDGLWAGAPFDDGFM
jgi:hypothetical protein